MKSRIEILDWIRIASFLELGLKSGRDWPSILEWTSHADANSSLKLYLRQLLVRMKWKGADEALHSAVLRAQSPEEKMFLHILMQNQRGLGHLSVLCTRFTQILRQVEKLRRHERALLFIPKFQAWTSVGVCLIFTCILPILAPGIFPQFYQQQRWDLFVLGFLGIGAGLTSLYSMTLRPQRHIRNLLNQTFFLYFISVFVESGRDLPGAWREALKISDLGSLNTLLTPPGVEKFEDFLIRISKTLTGSWPGILAGISWAKTSGTSISQYLREFSDGEAERLAWAWEFEVRKTSLLTFIPLAGLIFPSTLFLLIGPQILELTRTL